MTRSLFFSLTLHIVIVCLFIVGAVMQVKSPVVKRIGNIKAYVYHEPALIARHNSKAFPPSRAQQKYSRKKLRINSDRNRGVRRPKGIGLQDNTAQLSGKKNKLLVVLHNRIQQAVDDDLQGIPSFFKGRDVILMFRFSKDGRVSAVRLLKKSGVAAIDNTVQQILLSIELVRTARLYLRHSAAYMRLRIAIR